MLSFKQFVKQYGNNLNQYIFEHLTDREREEVDSKNLDTSRGETTTQNVIPSNSWHTEIPIDDPLTSRIKQHLRNNPSPHGHWNIIDHNTVQSPPYKDPNGITREGYKKPISQILKSDPELLKDYSEAGSRATPKTDRSIIPYNPEVNRVERDSKPNRWTAPVSNDTHKIIISRHPYAIQGKSSKLKPWNSCAKYGNCDYAAAHLDDDVEQGGAVAYLVRHDETDPNNPHKAVGRIALQPFTSASGHTVLRPSKRYGQDDESESFYNTVKNHLEQQQPLIDHEYKLNPHVYQGDHSNEQKTITKPLSNEEKIKMSNKLMMKIKNGEHTDDDLNHAKRHGYLNKKHKKELSNHLLEKIKNGTYNHDDLDHAILHGYLNDEHINKLTKNEDNHYELARAHQEVTNIGQHAINAIANNPDSTDAHYWLARAHREGKSIDQDNDKKAINAIANNPDSTDAHNYLTKAYREGKDIGQHAIDAIADNPKSTTAHSWLAWAHREGKDIGQHAIDAIADNPDSTTAHYDLAQAHQEGKYPIGQHAINAIADNPDSTSAHHFLAWGHATGKDIGQHAIDAIADNPDSTTAHNALVHSHREGKYPIGDHALQKLREYGHNL